MSSRLCGCDVDPVLLLEALRRLVADWGIGVRQLRRSLGLPVRLPRGALLRLEGSTLERVAALVDLHRLLMEAFGSGDLRLFE